MVKQILNFTALLFIITGIVFGQNRGNFQGTVIDSINRHPIIAANVYVQHTFLGSTTDTLGNFYIGDIRPGTYSIVCSVIGYRKEVIRNIKINKSPINLRFELKRDILAIPQVIVTATRKEQDIMESPFSVAVIGQREIREKSAVRLSEVLPYIPGVNTVRGQLNIRGASGYTLGAGSRSLLLIDGVPLLGSAAGNISWTIIPTSEIERVEIVKSAGGALYGSSGMGGVMNIITRNAPLEPKTTIRIKVGGYSQPRYSQWKWRKSPGYFHTVEITHGRTFSAHNGWIRMQKYSTDGYSQLDWEDAYNLTGKIKLNINSKLNASIYGNYYTEEVGLASQWKSAADPFEAPPGDDDDHSIGYKFHANGSMNIIFASDLIIKIKSGYFDVKWQNYGRTNQDNSREKKGFAEIQISKNLSNVSNINSGLSVQIADINAQLFGKHSSQSYAGFILFQQKLWSSLSVSLNGRMENFLVDNISLDRTFAPQFALNWNPTAGIALRASIGKGFRVPTIAELYTRSQLNIFRVEPNPGLRSETSLAYEFGGTLRYPQYGLFSNFALEGALFRTHFKNLIEPLPDENGIIHFENITNAVITGAELSLTTGIFSDLFKITAAYTWLDPVQINSSGSVIDTLSYRYRHHIVTSLSYRWMVALAGVEYRYASRIEKVELFQMNPVTKADKRVPIHIWNVFFGLQWPQWEVLFRVDNIFQYYYVELERNPGEERKISITLSKTF